MWRLTDLDRRRLANFRANRRAVWSVRLFVILCIISFPAELISNDKPFLVKFQGAYVSPILNDYPEAFFGGDPGFNTDYTDPFVQDLIRTNGDEAMDPGEEAGWILWPLVPYSYDTVNYDVPVAPSEPDANHWLGTDDQARDVMARVIYGFRLSVLFGFAVAIVSTVLGILLGAVQGFFGGWVDLGLQRFEEVWGSMPQLYVIMIIASVLTPSPVILFLIFIAFGWTALTGVVRAEFLRARNFEYVQAARALGVSDTKIMFRHMLPNAMVATLTFLPFILTGSIGLLTGLDYLGFGLGSGYPSLGELALQGNNNPNKLWLSLTAFFTFVIMLSLLVFTFEGVRDAFDPRKTFR